MKKQLKNKFIAVLVVFLMLSIAISVISFNNNKVVAEVNTLEEYNDRFSDTTLSSNWTAGNGGKMAVEKDALIFEAKEVDAYLDQITCNAYYMTGSCKVEIISISEYNNGYFAFVCGNMQVSTGMPYASAAFIMAPTYAHIFASTGQFIQVREELVQYFSPMVDKAVGKEIKTTFEFIEVSDFTYDIVYTVEEVVSGDVYGTYTYKAIPVQDGYFGLNGSAINCAITSFKVFEGEEVKYDCSDFSKKSIKYPASGDANAEWIVALSFNSSTLKIGNMAKADVSKVNSYLMYNTKYTRPLTNELETLYTAKIDVFAMDMGVGVATGFEIAKKSETERGVFAGITRDINGFYLTSFDGVNVKRQPLSSSSIDGVTMTLTTNYSNTATISIGNDSLTFDVNDVEGYLALTTLDFYDIFADEKGALLDNFIFLRNQYVNVQSKDASINFEGIKTTYYDAIGDYMSDYYINRNDWYLSDDVIIPMYSPENDGNSLIFLNEQTNSAFGPNRKYTNFIVRFDITFIDEIIPGQSTPMFGLQFGKPNLDVLLSKTNSLGFQVYPVLDYVDEETGEWHLRNQTFVYTTGSPLSNGKAIAPLYEDAYNSTEKMLGEPYTTYNFMYVVQNGTARVYVKEESEPDSALSILRAEMTDIETEGFVSVYAFNYAMFNLDNFSIVNLDYGYTSSEYDGYGLEKLRLDFALGDKITQFDLKNTSQTDTSLLINKNGFIKSKDKIENEIFRFTTKKSDGDVIFEQGELKIVFDKGGEKIFAYYNKKVREFDLTTKLNFDGALIEVVKIGNRVDIAYVNSNEPRSCIGEQKFSIIADNIFNENLKLYSNNGTLELSNLAVFDLKKNVTITTRDYNEALDYFNAWPVRKSIQDGDGSGCSSSISVDFILAPVLIAVAIVLIRGKKKNEENN